MEAELQLDPQLTQNSELSNHYVGQRLSYDGGRCTIRYCGPVYPTTGYWLGVEWDGPEPKGKHDGRYLKKRYFKCFSDSPIAASFVRPTRPSDQTRGFLEALVKKYIDKENAIFPLDQEFDIIDGRPVEEVGFDKIRRQQAALQDLRIVVLEGLCMTGIKDRNNENILEQWQRIKSRDLRITYLDLSRNLLEQWSDVVGICAALKETLRSLNLSGNIFWHLKYPKLGQWTDPFANVTDLSLCSTHLSWREVIHILPQFPSLKDLQLSYNGLGKLPGCLPAPNLESLDLTSNKIAALDELSYLINLPKLTKLFLRDNPTQCIISGLNFMKIEFLDLTSTRIQDFDTVDNISMSFPSLRSLLTSSTALAQHPSGRILTIARIPQLEELNHIPIKADERREAETYYVNAINKELYAATDPGEIHRVLLGNPRYKPLSEENDGLTFLKELRANAEKEKEKKAKEEVAPGTLAARLTRFTFYMTNVDFRMAQKQVPLQDGIPQEFEYIGTSPSSFAEKSKLIPRTVDIYRVKAIVGRIFGFKPMFCRLVWETGEWDPVGSDVDEGWSVSEDVRSSDNENDSDDNDDSNHESDTSEYFWTGKSYADDDEDVSPGSDTNVKEKNIRHEAKIVQEWEIKAGGQGTKRRSLSNLSGLSIERKMSKGWKQREVELVDGMRAVGNWIEGKEARVRVEFRELLPEEQSAAVESGV